MSCLHAGLALDALRVFPQNQLTIADTQNFNGHQSLNVFIFYGYNARSLFAIFFLPGRPLDNTGFCLITCGSRNTGGILSFFSVTSKVGLISFPNELRLLIIKVASSANLSFTFCRTNEWKLWPMMQQHRLFSGWIPGINRCFADEINKCVFVHRHVRYWFVFSA